MEESSWQRLRREQENVVALAQLTARGITESSVRAHVAGGRWVPLHRGVYATVTGEPTPAMWRWAALLFVRGPVMLSHASAAAVLKLPGGTEDGPVHLTVPYGSSARGCPGIVLHRSRAFAHIGLPDAVPPTTDKVQTLIDLAVASPDARAAMRVLTAGAAAGKVAGEAIRAALELRQPRHYRRPLIAAATLLAEGVESVLEHDFALDVERAHQLPRPTRQVRRRLDSGRIVEDLEYAAPGGTLTIRLDGWAYHRNRRTAYRDRRRDNAAELEGRARLTFGTEEVTGAPCTTARTVALRLRQLGWDGVLVRCRACEHLPSL